VDVRAARGQRRRDRRELWLHIAPITLGAGERLFDGVDLALEPVAARNTDLVTHVRYRVPR